MRTIDGLSLRSNRMKLAVQHAADLGRFQIQVEGQWCVADYRLEGNAMTVTHTGVPSSLEGRGIAAALMQALLEHARVHGFKVRPQCPYAAAYMQRHPETAALLAS